MPLLNIRKISTLKRPLQLGIDDAVVMVKHNGPDQAKAFAAAVGGKPRLGPDGEVIDTMDGKKWLQFAPAYYVDASECSGFTNSVIRSLGIDLVDDLPVIDATTGEVAVTDELIAELWQAAKWSRFGKPIMELSDGMLAVVEREKKSALPTSDAS